MLRTRGSCQRAMGPEATAVVKRFDGPQSRCLHEHQPRRSGLRRRSLPPRRGPATLCVARRRPAPATRDQSDGSADRLKLLPARCRRRPSPATGKVELGHYASGRAGRSAPARRRAGSWARTHCPSGTCSTPRSTAKACLAGLSCAVRAGRLELPRVAPPDPKSGASTDSATPAARLSIATRPVRGRGTAQLAHAEARGEVGLVATPARRPAPRRTRGSRWLPALRRSSSMPSPRVRSGRYTRSEVMAE